MLNLLLSRTITPSFQVWAVALPDWSATVHEDETAGLLHAAWAPDSTHLLLSSDHRLHHLSPFPHFADPPRSQSPPMYIPLPKHPIPYSSLLFPQPPRSLQSLTIPFASLPQCTFPYPSTLSAPSPSLPTTSSVTVPKTTIFHFVFLPSPSPANPRSQSPPVHIPLPKHPIRALAFSTNHLLLAALKTPTFTSNPLCIILPFRTPANPHSQSPPVHILLPKHPIRALAFSTNHLLLAALKTPTFTSNPLCIFLPFRTPANPHSQSPPVHILLPKHPIRALAFSTNHLLLAALKTPTFTSNPLCIFLPFRTPANPHSQSPPVHILLPKHPIRALAFATNHLLLAALKTPTFTSNPLCIFLPFRTPANPHSQSPPVHILLPKHPIRALAFSTNHLLLAVLKTPTFTSNPLCIFLPFRTPANPHSQSPPVHILLPKHPIRALAFATNHLLLAALKTPTFTSNPLCIFLPFRTPANPHSQSPPVHILLPKHPIRALAFSTNHLLLAALKTPTFTSNPLCIFLPFRTPANPHSQSPPVHILLPKHPIRALAFSTNHLLLAALKTPTFTSNPLCIFLPFRTPANPHSQSPPVHILLPKHPIRALAFSTNHLLLHFPLPKHPVRALAFSPNHLLLAALHSLPSNQSMPPAAATPAATGATEFGAAAGAAGAAGAAAGVGAGSANARRTSESSAVGLGGVQGVRTEARGGARRASAVAGGGGGRGGGGGGGAAGQSRDVVSLYACDTWQEVVCFRTDTVDAADVAWAAEGSGVIVWDHPMEFRLLLFSPSGEPQARIELPWPGLGVRAVAPSPAFSLGAASHSIAPCNANSSSSSTGGGSGALPGASSGALVAVGCSADRLLRVFRAADGQPVVELPHAPAVKITLAAAAVVYEECLGVSEAATTMAPGPIQWSANRSHTVECHRGVPSHALR
ncbi:unnamed protein product [Closterium sp. Naga37s-1]|nr:unnamed protein product [Closterium sp. Naga37s-1]